MKDNRNKGFSMIELILVIGIMGLFTAFATIGFGYLQSGNVKSTARNIDATLSKLKLDTMKMSNTPKMHIYKSGNDYYMYCTANDYNPATDGLKGEKIGNQNVSITASGGAKGSIGSGEEYIIEFDKGKGTFQSSYTHLYVKHSDGKGITYDIEMIPETGKHFINVN